MKQGKKCRIISYEDMNDQDNSIIGAFLGAPLVAIEKVTTGNEVVSSVETMKEFYENKGKKITSLMSAEIGGMNSIAPLYTAAQLDLPLVDADGMGRAYPEV